MLSQKLQPHVRRLLEDSAAEGAPPLETMSPREARKAAAEAILASGGVPEPVHSIENLEIPSPGGPIRLRVYTPETPAPRPALLYFHGGGWVVCDLDTHHVVSSAIARRSGAVVINVDYRLAPENKFPAAVEGCYAATLWVASNAGKLGVDPLRICTGGDSAGGNLATVMCLKSRDENGPPIALQVMIYPVTDLSSFDTPSYQEFGEDHQLTRSEMEWFRENYLPGMADALNPHASPLLAPDLRGLPPALVITAECDPLRDEGEAYAKRLEEAGVEVKCTRYAGMIHPFFSLSGVIPEALDAIEEVAGALGNAAGLKSGADGSRAAVKSSY